MDLTWDEYGTVGVMTVPGPRLDSSLAANFRDAAREIMAAGQDVWIVDLSKVTFVDSSGVGALVGLLKFMGRDRKLELCGMSPIVRKVFRMTRLDSVFTIKTDLDEALAAHGSVRSRATS